MPRGRPRSNVCTGSAAEGVAELLARLAEEALTDERISAAVEREAERIRSAEVKRIEVTQSGFEPVDVGFQHKNFELLLRSCTARGPDGHRLNVWLVGPPGSGKTTAAKMVARALNLPFYTVGAMSTKFEVTGYMTPDGSRYVESILYKPWTEGGVFLADEFDGNNPNAAVALNGATGNGVYAFPNGMKERHPDCVIIAGANTFGNGGTVDYVGRFKQDIAALDRFVFIEWPIDEELEMKLSSNKEWVLRVQEVRRKLTEKRILGRVVSPRAIVYGDALLRAGIDQPTVERMVLQKGIPDNEWKEMLE